MNNNKTTIIIPNRFIRKASCHFLMNRFGLKYISSNSRYIYPLLHRNLHTLLTNLRNDNSAARGRECGSAVCCCGRAEGNTINSEEINSLVCIKTGEGDETTCWLDNNTTSLPSVDVCPYIRRWKPIKLWGSYVRDIIYWLCWGNWNVITNK